MPVKSVAQQELVALHRIRDQWMATRTARLNALRGVLREHGVAVPAGATRGLTTIPLLLADATVAVPRCLRHTLALLDEEIRALEVGVTTVERELTALVASDPVSQRLQTVPGIGLLTATAVRGRSPTSIPFVARASLPVGSGSPPANARAGAVAAWARSPSKAMCICGTC